MSVDGEFRDVITAQTTTATRRFAVAWRNTRTRSISPVAVLDFGGGLHRFWYRRDCGGVQDFKPFLGFDDSARVYESGKLFPFFAVRVMDRRRPDFASYVHSLGLGTDASQLDILSRSGGQRKGDTVQVMEIPLVRGGLSQCTFLVRGMRYATESFLSAETADRLGAGCELSLLPDRTNSVNPSALLIATEDGLALGWVPDLLVDYAHLLVRKGTATLRVVRNNGRDVPWHLRLLVRLQGSVPDDYRAFDDLAWAPPAVASAGSIACSAPDAAAETSGFATSVRRAAMPAR